MKTITKFPPPVDIDAPLRSVRGLPAAARVDTERHIIFGAAVIQSGPLNVGDSRPWIVDDATLLQVVATGNENPKGLKARWTHPNISSDGLGKFLGRWRSFRLAAGGQTVLADLHLSPIAFKGGETSRGAHVEEMAATEPDALAVSIFPVLDRTLMEQLQNREGKQPMRLLKLVAADIVDEAAATRGGLFGGQLSMETAEQYAKAALDQIFPAGTPPELIRARAFGFLSTFLANRRPSPALAQSATVATFAPAQNSLAPADAWAAYMREFGMGSGTVTETSYAPLAGVPLASFDAAEAQAFNVVRPFVAEYLANASIYAADGVSLGAFIDSRLIDMDGRAKDGRSPLQMNATLRSAVEKQSAIVAKSHPLSPFNGVA